VERMIETVERVCQPWGTSQEKLVVSRVSKKRSC
jgi:hypothetical protein